MEAEQHAPSVGVLGGGIFGVSAALELREQGYDVTIFESQGALLQGATARNLFRIHRGFHYPRDEPTARQASIGFDSFVRTYREAVEPGSAQYYAMADHGSRTSVAEFERHCRQVGLQAEVVDRPAFLTDAVERCWQVYEPYFDPVTLRRIISERLRQAGIRIVLDCPATADEIARNHDYLVLAIYADTNEALHQLGLEALPLQYDLCEVPVVRSPRLRDHSVVVMDGPFVSLAPYRGDSHLLYDVQHSVHDRVTATSKPAFPPVGQDHAGLAPPGGAHQPPRHRRFGDPVRHRAGRRRPPRVALLGARGPAGGERYRRPSDLGALGVAAGPRAAVRQDRHLRRCRPHGRPGDRSQGGRPRPLAAAGGMTEAPPRGPHPVRFGLVGIGHWGRRLAPHLDHQGQLLAVCSTGGPDGRAWLADHLPGVAPVTAIDELLALPIDAVVIASPRATHERIVEAAIRSGRDVLVEKPLAAHGAAAEALGRLAREHGRVLTVDYTHLFDSAFEELCRRAGELGELGPLELVLDWRKPGAATVDDVLYEFFPHVLSMALSLDPSVQVRQASAVAGPDETVVKARLVGPRAALDARVAVGGAEREKQLVARGSDAARDLIWTDRKLEERRGSDVITLHDADEEPLARVVASFVEAVSADGRGVPDDRSRPSAVVATRTPALLDDLIDLVRAGADPA
ncbi:FAD-dependent oxidoreductase [Aquihabitans daechungensis]|uniref:FAD-dependent oxidoreductase n=1 Tax=Aquihabitans daechungensis TaxID=1052257 RepID=UPI003BA134CB